MEEYTSLELSILEADLVNVDINEFTKTHLAFLELMQKNIKSEYCIDQESLKRVRMQFGFSGLALDISNQLDDYTEYIKENGLVEDDREGLIKQANNIDNAEIFSSHETEELRSITDARLDVEGEEFNYIKVLTDVIEIREQREKSMHDNNECSCGLHNK